MKTLRGSIFEESVPSAARHTTPRGLSPKRLLEFIMPELNLHCLRLASNSPKVRDTLLKLDEQGLNFQRKVGVMYCRAGQSSEEDMYNNESSGPAFEEFLDLLGERVRLKGWEKYRAQLDNKSELMKNIPTTHTRAYWLYLTLSQDHYPKGISAPLKRTSTGTHSLYTRYQDYEIMFHVSTMLPYTSNNTQQLLRKRHVGNDIVTIVFQEPGALPFTPKTIRSHFQHVFIIIQVHEPCTDNTYYRVAVTRSKDMPLFGPLFPKGARFPRSSAFRDFLLAKAVNAETLQRIPPALSGGKAQDKLKGAKGAELHSAGALVWAVMVNSGYETEAGEHRLPCLLGVSAESVVLIERCTRRVVFNCSCRDVIGWKAVTETKQGGPYLDIFYERGESVSISVMESQAEDIREVVQRLELVTRGCEALEVTPLRDGVGQPGFLMNEEGFVTDLQRFCYAESGGLQLWARVVRLCGHSLVHLSPDERVRLLRTAHKIHITVIPPDENGKPRRLLQKAESSPSERERERDTNKEEEVSSKFEVFSELYQKAIKDAECKPGEDQSGEAWVLDEREEEEVEAEGEEEEEEEVEEEVEEVKEDTLKASEVIEADVTEVKVEDEEDVGRSCDEGQSERSPGSLLTPPSLPLLRATSLQEQPANQSQEGGVSHLTRSCSYTDTCDGMAEHILKLRLTHRNLISLGACTNNVGLKGERHIYENDGELRDAMPDLILAVKPKVPLEDEQFTAAEFGDDKASASDSSTRLSCLDRAERNSRALSLHNSITKILSETTESTEEEWQSIADLATACRSILEALSREDRKAGDPSQAGVDQTDGKLRDSKDSDSPGHLEEKVSQLESMLKRLQDDLQRCFDFHECFFCSVVTFSEKEDKAVLQAEVQSLRQNNQRLQEESQSTVARLIKVTELLCNVNKPC
ncbi:hypothetical protein KUCAC02_003705 [Chaenocephalus aceratus]|uniref:Uncharacterized protein n=1 Tax=Chaenocephalus aceratus TaxID=36190 RepID=A0ACB9WMZ4_CHAAC|nr:hypothetical protein KUCAC02_003705 [Chaenocephalus aceratus]